MNATQNTFGLFSRTSSIVQVHIEGCAMLNRANGRKHANLIKVDMAEVEDLREREFKIVVCKCAK
jgi:hypothetical protein